jgi:hypothetical protein
VADDDESDGDHRSIPIHWSWRGVAVLLAAGGLGLGARAVFTTHSEAGPVALIAIGLLFAIVAMAGVLPFRIKIGDNEFELAKERKKNKRLTGAITDLSAAADPKKPEVQEAVGNLERDVPDAGSAARRALGFEATVQEALKSICERRGDVFVPPEQLVPTADLSKTPTYQPAFFDGMIHRADNQRRALVEIKASAQPIDARWINTLHERFIRGVNQYSAEMLLLVTNEPLSRQAGMRIAEFTDKVWVIYSGPHDMTNLEAAVERLIGKLHWER